METLDDGSDDGGKEKEILRGNPMNLRDLEIREGSVTGVLTQGF